MFCFPQHDHHPSTRILHSFRSHRSLRASATRQSQQHQLPAEVPSSPSLDMHFPRHHHRQPSDAPTTTTRDSSDSSRPSTSGARSDSSSIEWNPLGLHPPLAPAPRLHQQRSLHSFHQHLQLQQATAAVPVPVKAAPRPGHGHSRSAPPPALVIYDGFDFGFGAGEKSGSVASTPSSTPGGMRRPGPPGGMDGPDFFIKRGGWKRRGIVFSPVAGGGEEAGCDEVFDLEC